MEYWMLQKKLIQGITLKENVNILGNTLIGFHADNKIRGSIPLSCPCVQYWARTRRQLAQFIGLSCKSQWVDASVD